VNDAAKTKDIALKLGLSGHTIERYMETLLAKKGVSTQKELIVKYYKEILNEVTYGKN
jgi:DNA-binding CsgD family transcriptional regulator